MSTRNLNLYDMEERIHALEENSGNTSTYVNKSDIAPDFSDATNYYKGDLVYYEGVLYEFQLDHSEGTWEQSEVQNKDLSDIINTIPIEAGVPIGVILPYGGGAQQPPTNWLYCLGQEVSRTAYSELFAVIRTQFGEGDGSTTFNLPDMRESVPKGAGRTSKSNNHVSETGLVVGAFLDDRIQEHNHPINFNSNDAGSRYAVQWTSEKSTNDDVSTIGGVVNGRSGTTTEVKSVGVNYIIKAK